MNYKDTGDYSMLWCTEKAENFLSVVAPSGMVTFQTFKDTEGDKTIQNNKICPLILHGVNEENLSILEEENKKGAGIFFMPNEGNGLGRSTKDVIAVRSFFLDIDTDGPRKFEKIMELPVEHKPQVITESSPGRYHAYWLIKPGFSLTQFKAVQKALIAKFGGDPLIHDLPRVMRLPGFNNLKNPNQPFECDIIFYSEVPRYDAYTLIKNLKLDLVENTSQSNFDLLPITREPVPEGQRNDTIFRHGCSLRSRGTAESVIRAELTELNRVRCVPPLSQSELDAIVESIMRYPEGEPPQERAQTYTDLNNAEHFIALFGDRLRYVPEFKKWIIWDGRRWAIDEAGKVLEYAKKTIRHAQQQATQIEDAERRQRTIRKLLECENVNRIKAIPELAKIDDQIVLHQHELDRDPYLINVLNGTVDMLSQTFKAHDPKDYITKLQQVEYEQPFIIMP